MSGTVIRKRHECTAPVEKDRGDVFRCSCGRRYTARPCVLSDTGNVLWHRRVWPWPR